MKGKMMRRSLVKLSSFLLILPLAVMLFGCASPQPTDNPNLIWNVDLLKFEVKDKLENIETVPQYVGSTEEVHYQYPDEGNVFLIMEVNISKPGTDVTPFDWSKLTVQDEAGNIFQRDSNDTFLEQFEYTPRITGLEIKFGVNEGWLCYEIPAQSAKGKLTLIYSDEGSQQEIIVKK
jgi:hypothetical protein